MAQDVTPQPDLHRLVVTEPPKFDLDSYIANYDGLTRLSRLIVIGTTSTYLARDALHAALTEAKQGKNVNQYNEVVQALYRVAPESLAAVPDIAWIDATTKRVKAETDRLEHELKGYKNNLIKESIRPRKMGNEDMGAFYYETGDYAAAFKSFSRMREYCTTPKHISEMSQRLILVSIAQDQWMNVQSHVFKIRMLNLKPDDKARTEAALTPVLGLAQMASGQYREAATSFLQSDPAFLVLETLGSGAGGSTVRFNRQVLTGNDIAVYGGLCALATMDRSELQTRLLDNSTFRNFLELEPHVRRAAAAFCASKFTASLDVLAAYRADYLLDLHLHRHVGALYAAIRRKSIVQYFGPFSRARLAVMAAAFKTPEARMLDELAEMIRAGVLDARVDLVDGMLVAGVPEPRGAVHARALDMARAHDHQLRLRLLKINMQAAGLELKASKQGPVEGRSIAGRRSKHGE